MPYTLLQILDLLYSPHLKYLRKHHVLVDTKEGREERLAGTQGVTYAGNLLGPFIFSTKRRGRLAGVGETGDCYSLRICYYTSTSNQKYIISTYMQSAAGCYWR